MHGSKLKFIAFDERCFPDAPVQLDDGAFSHFLIPDEDDCLPVLKRGGEDSAHFLQVGARESEHGLLLVFSLFEEGGMRIDSRLLCVSGKAVRMPHFASPEEREELKNAIYARSCEKVLGDWFESVNHEFFETLAIFARAAVEEAYGDLLTSFSDEPESFESRQDLHTTH